VFSVASVVCRALCSKRMYIGCVCKCVCNQGTSSVQSL